MYLKRHASRLILSSCPLVIWRKSYSSNLCPKHASETVFSLLWEEGHPSLPPHPRLSPHSVTSLPRIGDMEIQVISRGALSLMFSSLNIMMNVSETACLKLDVIVLPPCYLEEIKSYSNSLCPNMQSFPCPGRGMTPPPPPPPACSFRSLTVLLADYFRRHGNIRHYHRRSLAHYNDGCIGRCDRLAPFLFGGYHIF